MYNFEVLWLMFILQYNHNFKNTNSDRDITKIKKAKNFEYGIKENNILWPKTHTTKTAY